MLKFFTFSTLIVLVVACGQDIGKTKRDSTTKKETTTEGATSDTGSTLLSQVHRNHGTTILTIAEEIEKTLKETLNGKYRIIPNIALDDEGMNNKNVLFAGRPATTCGSELSFGGIDKRMADCKTNNPKTFAWDGAEKGAAGESLWQLVYNNEASSPVQEIWLDTKTGLVWTDVIKDKGNWCQASGNDESPTDDPENEVDCAGIIAGESFCTEYSVPGMGSNIFWRLPTRNDLLQADINGMRFVFIQQNVDLWTATLVAGKPHRDYAWVYNDKTGVLSEANMRTTKSIRCVGAPVR